MRSSFEISQSLGHPPDLLYRIHQIERDESGNLVSRAEDEVEWKMFDKINVKDNQTHISKGLTDNTGKS